MSVPQPLAADGSHANAERDLQDTGRRTPVAARDVGGDESEPGAGKRSMLPEQVVVAPTRLGLTTRMEFREAASELIDRTMAGTGRLVIDCGRLRSIDSSGLNVLILVQRRAANRRIQVFLRELDEELQSLLILTKLDDLFEMQDGQSH